MTSQLVPLDDLIIYMEVSNSDEEKMNVLY